MVKNKDDWEDVPLDDWEDVHVPAPTKSAPSPEPTTNLAQDAGQTGLDFFTGGAQGLTMGAADELSGLIGAGVETGLGALGIGPSAVDDQLTAQGFQVPEESFLQKYRSYQQATENEQKAAMERSPYANIGGQLAGGVAGGAVLGSALGIGKAAQGAKSISDIARDSGKAKAALELLTRGASGYTKAIPAIGLESALTSEKQLLGPDSDIGGVAKDVAGGVAFGLPVALGLSGVTELAVPSISKKAGAVTEKIKDAFESEEHPRLRQMAKAYTEYGQNLGINPRSHGQDIGGQKFALRDEKAISSVMGTLDQADAKLGQQVGDSLKQATERGAIIDVSPDIQAAADRVAQLSQTIPELGNSRRSAAAYDKMLAGSAQLNPSELKTLIDDIDSSIGVFKSATNITPQDASTLSELMRFRTSISDSLKKSVPEYRQAAERFENFRQVLEQIISRDKPAGVTNKFYGRINDADNKVYSSLQDMVRNVQRDDAASQPARTSFVNFMDALQDFEQKEASRIAANPNLQKVTPSTDEVRKFVLDASDDSVLRGSSRATTQGRSLVPDLKEAIIGKAPTAIAFHAGKISKKAAPILAKTADVGKAIYNAPAQTLSNLASKLETSGTFSGVGKALREAIESGNTAKKNAALFTIMQNPNARLFIEPEATENEQEK